LRSPVIDLIVAALGIAFLYMFFRVAEMAWPNSYYAQGDARSFRISKNPLGYLLFRFSPVIVVAYFLASALLNANRSPTLALVLLAVGHASVHVGRAMYTIATVEQTSMWSRGSLLLGYALVILGVATAVPLGALVAQDADLRALVPSARELTSSLWTGVFAAIIGAFFLRATEGGDVTVEEMIRYVRSTVKEDFFSAAKQAAAKYGADPTLVETILIVECLQRPRWVRTLERQKGRFVRRGTYGVMQAYAERPLSDLESIDVAVREKLAGARVPLDENGCPQYDSRFIDGDAVKQTVRTYNPRRAFLDLSSSIYNALTQERKAAEEGLETL